MKKFAPISGIVFVALLIVAIVFSGGEPPSADDPVQEIVDHYADNDTSIFISALISNIALVFLLFFANFLRKLVSAAEGPGNSLVSPLILVGAGILSVGLALDQTLLMALAQSAEDIDPSAVQAIQAIWDNDFLPIALGSLLFWLSLGIGIVMTGVLPKWLGWVAMVLGIAGTSPVFFVSLALGALWILVVSVMLARRGEDGTPGPVTPAAGPAA